MERSLSYIVHSVPIFRAHAPTCINRVSVCAYMDIAFIWPSANIVFVFSECIRKY